jgi:hypothetical protein
MSRQEALELLTILVIFGFIRIRFDPEQGLPFVFRRAA